MSAIGPALTIVADAAGVAVTVGVGVRTGLGEGVRAARAICSASAGVPGMPPLSKPSIGLIAEHV
ncbi:MAG: hypothetical protein Q8S22_05540 [Eubacteriales bacterium]|nr:hypothetical protein [Eubacteriales bacterium]